MSNIRVRELADIRAVATAAVPEDLALVNRYALTKVTEEEIHVRKMQLAHNQYDRTGERFPKAYLERFAETLPGKSLLAGHATDSLPLGRWFEADTRTRSEEFPVLIRDGLKGADCPHGLKVGDPDDVTDCALCDAEAKADPVPGFTNQQQRVTWLDGRFFFVNDPTTEGMRKNIDAGVWRHGSIGFKYADLTCDLCSKSYLGAGCPHVIMTTTDEGKLVTATYSGDPKQVEAREGSVVYLGAQQEAGFVKALRDGTLDPKALAVTPHGEDLVALKRYEHLARQYGAKQTVWATGGASWSQDASTIVKVTYQDPPPVGGATSSIEGDTTKDAAVAAKGDQQMSEQDKAQLAELQAKFSEATAEASAAAKRADLAEEKVTELAAKVDELGPLANVGTQALSDLSEAYLGHTKRLGRDEAEIAEIAALLVKAGNYARLKQLHDSAWAQVCERFPAGLSGDPSVTGPPSSNSSRRDPAEVCALAGR